MKEIRYLYVLMEEIVSHEYIYLRYFPIFIFFELLLLSLFCSFLFWNLFFIIIIYQRIIATIISCLRLDFDFKILGHNLTLRRFYSTFIIYMLNNDIYCSYCNKNLNIAWSCTRKCDFIRKQDNTVHEFE